MDSSQKSSSGFDLTDLSDNIYKDFQDIVPQALTFGPENVLYHYVQLDAGDGIILSSLNDQLNAKNDLLLDVFRRSCIKIHLELQNSMKFRHILSKESKVTNSRSLVAIKEHGILVKLKLNNDANLEVWIIGRLFTAPQREIYVLVEADIPQNLVEIAFRICLNCVG